MQGGVACSAARLSATRTLSWAVNGERMVERENAALSLESPGRQHKLRYKTDSVHNNRAACRL